jgi:hypothetical protein
VNLLISTYQVFMFVFPLRNVVLCVLLLTAVDGRCETEKAGIRVIFFTIYRNAICMWIYGNIMCFVVFIKACISPCRAVCKYVEAVCSCHTGSKISKLHGYLSCDMCPIFGINFFFRGKGGIFEQGALNHSNIRLKESIRISLTEPKMKFTRMMQDV